MLSIEMIKEAKSQTITVDDITYINIDWVIDKLSKIQEEYRSIDANK